MPTSRATQTTATPPCATGTSSFTVYFELTNAPTGNTTLEYFFGNESVGQRAFDDGVAGDTGIALRFGGGAFATALGASTPGSSHEVAFVFDTNLDTGFAYVDGEALMMSMRDLAVSSGSACTSTNPEPSHVLRALGLSDDLTRASLRFGLGRFNTAEEVEFAITQVADTVRRLRKLSSMANPLG